MISSERLCFQAPVKYLNGEEQTARDLATYSPHRDGPCYAVLFLCFIARQSHQSPEAACDSPTPTHIPILPADSPLPKLASSNTSAIQKFFTQRSHIGIWVQSQTSDHCKASRPCSLPDPEFHGKHPFDILPFLGKERMAPPNTPPSCMLSLSKSQVRLGSLDQVPFIPSSQVIWRHQAEIPK